jgi:hypothetical protein
MQKPTYEKTAMKHSAKAIRGFLFLMTSLIVIAPRYGHDLQQCSLPMLRFMHIS